MTEVRPALIEHVVSPSQEERVDLKRMLSNPRQRTSSTMSDLGMSYILYHICTSATPPLFLMLVSNVTSDWTVRKFSRIYRRS